MGTNYIRLNKLIDQLDGFALRDLIIIAELIEINLKFILDLVYKRFRVSQWLHLEYIIQQ
jgi:hypothetical protein